MQETFWADFRSLLIHCFSHSGLLLIFRGSGVPGGALGLARRPLQGRPLQLLMGWGVGEGFLTKS